MVDSLRKNITREYKAKLTKDQRKAFRSQMWAFRRDPESLSAEEKQALEALFEKIPALRPLYKVRLRFKEIFDTARDRITAARWLRELRRECGQLGLDLGSFFETYDRWNCQFAEYLYRLRGIFCWKSRGFQGEGGATTTSGGIMAG